MKIIQTVNLVPVLLIVLGTNSATGQPTANVPPVYSVHHPVDMSKFSISNCFKGDNPTAPSSPRKHVGVDYATLEDGKCNNEVKTIGPGKVVFAGIIQPGTIGRAVQILHRSPEHGKFWSVYWHLNDYTVFAGQDLSGEEVIGHVGSADGSCSINVHLHFEIRTGAFDRWEGAVSIEPEAGHFGYIYLSQTDDWDKYTDPYRFIEDFDETLLNQRPGAFTLENPVTVNMDAMPTCTDEDNTQRPCFKWTRSSHAAFYDVFMDGIYQGRTYEDDKLIIRDPHKVPSEDDIHSWFVIARNFFAMWFSFSPGFPLEGSLTKDGPSESQFSLTGGGCGSSCGRPIVKLRSTRNITAGGALVRASITPNGHTTTYHLEWNSALAEKTTKASTNSNQIGSGYTAKSVGENLSSLDCSTTYQYRWVATNQNGTTYASDSFTTETCDPDGGDIPPEPFTIELDDMRCGEVSFYWLKQAGTDHRVYRDGVEIGHYSSGIHSIARHVDHENLVPETFYEYHIVATNSHGTETSSPLLVFYPPYICTLGEDAPNEFVLFAGRQTCDGTEPATVLSWPDIHVSGTGNTYSTHRTDGGYDAETNVAAEGPVHAVSTNLVVGNGYDFLVETSDGQGAIQSTTATVHIMSDECSLGGKPSDPPGTFAAWVESVHCENNKPAVTLRWTTSAGADSYSFERIRVGYETGAANILGNTYLDTDNIQAGEYEYYMVSANNASGSKSAFPPQQLNVFIPSDVCGDSGLPGEFTLYHGEPFCENGVPAVRLSWLPPEGADPLQAWNRTDGNHRGTVNTDSTGFTTVVTGLSFVAGMSYGFFAQVHTPGDEDKTRESNTVYVHVPVDVCGLPTSPPTSTTWPALYATESSVHFKGGVKPMGSATSAHFEFGESSSYGSSTLPRNAGSGVDWVTIGVTVSGLSCEKTYHYRLVATNSFGTTRGSDRTFTTARCTNIPPTITLIEPDGSNDSADHSFTVAWSDDDPNDNAEITLSRSTDAGCSNASVIVSGISEDDETDRYRWYTAGISNGDYWIRADIDDGKAPVGTSCSSGKVTVSHPVPAVTDAWFSIDSGVVASSAGEAFTIYGTIGQADAGMWSGGVFSLLGGFWAVTSDMPVFEDGFESGDLSLWSKSVGWAPADN